MIPVVVVHEHDVLMGFQTIRPRVTGFAIDLTCRVRAQSINGTLLGVLLVVVQSLHKEIQLSGEHLRPLDGVHAMLMGLESFLAPTHI